MGALQTASYVFALIGVGAVLPPLYRFLVFSYVYFPGLHNGDIKKYMWSKRPYALVTASTDGIGKAVAKELFSRGFNLIIHGRNAKKLATVRDEILGSESGDRDVRLWCEDGAKGGWEPTELLALVDGLDLTVIALVNGGSDLKKHPIDAQKDAEVQHVMNLNFFFSVFIIRTLLPSLRATSERGPVSLLAFGSFATIMPLPYASVYAASKAALEAVTRGVGADARFEGRGKNLDVKYLQLGGVSSAANTTPPNWQTPSAAAFAKDVVRRIRAPWQWVAPNFTHAFLAWSTTLMTDSMVDSTGADVVRALMEELGKKGASES